MMNKEVAIEICVDKVVYRMKMRRLQGEEFLGDPVEVGGQGEDPADEPPRRRQGILAILIERHLHVDALVAAVGEGELVDDLPQLILCLADESPHAAR